MLSGHTNLIWTLASKGVVGRKCAGGSMVLGEEETNLIRSSRETASLVIHIGLGKGSRSCLKCIVSIWRDLSFLRSKGIISEFGDNIWEVKWYKTWKTHTLFKTLRHGVFEAFHSGIYFSMKWRIWGWNETPPDRFGQSKAMVGWHPLLMVVKNRTWIGEKWKLPGSIAGRVPQNRRFDSPIQMQDALAAPTSPISAIS